MWSFLPIIYLLLIISTTSAVADTSKSLWVLQIILLEYLPVSTTCTSYLQPQANYCEEEFGKWGEVSHGSKTHWLARGAVMATTRETSHQLGSGPNRAVPNNSPTNPNRTLTGNGQGGKSSYSKHAWRGSCTGFLEVLSEKDRPDNNQEIIMYDSSVSW